MAQGKTYNKEDKKEIITAICNDVVLNDSSFKNAIDKSPIGRVCFYQWIANDDKLETLYKYAREVRADALFEEAIEIADTPQEGVETTDFGDGRKQVKTGDMTQHRRLQVDTRKWAVAKMAPKKYGDKQEIDLNHSGKVDIKPKEWVKGKSK